MGTMNNNGNGDNGFFVNTTLSNKYIYKLHKAEWVNSLVKMESPD